MRNLSLLFLLTTFILSCQQGPKHPQAELLSQQSPTAMNPMEIVQYADSIEASIGDLDKAVSLIYSSGEKSFHIEKYSINGKPMVIVKQSGNEGISSFTEKYYFKNDSLVLIRQVASSRKSSNDAVKNERVFIRNNVPFKKDLRFAANQQALAKLPFQEYRNTKLPFTNYADSLIVLNDALEGSNTFEMVFDQYIAAEAGSYVLLKSKLPGGYTANVKVNERDPFIDSLEMDPLVFKDTKLSFKWALKNNEAIYVPVPVKVTSAKGLNR
ncbi:hypothetical protein [Pedobacter sp. JCM 36344]|uniref:hypothetical protein n=1 Tax=Pedobacter sp. JCM 36344 TaxID=3374280 RepID=UPI00397DD03E